MNALIDRLHAQSRTIPIKPERRVKSVTRLESGALRVTQHGGGTFDIDPDDELFQTFTVYTVLGEL